MSVNILSIIIIYQLTYTPKGFNDFEDEEINELYNHPKVKAHVSFTHGEGFGRPLLEASLSEKPVIAPNWGGQVDFLSKDSSVLLPGSLNEVKPESLMKGLHVKETKWFTVNYNYASKMLKDVFENYDKELFEPVIFSPYAKVYKLKR